MALAISLSANTSRQKVMTMLHLPDKAPEMSRLFFLKPQPVTTIGTKMDKNHRIGDGSPVEARKREKQINDQYILWLSQFAANENVLRKGHLS